MPALDEDGEVSVDGTDLGSEMSVRWHSFKRAGIEDDGKRAGSEKEYIDAKRFEAYGNLAEGPGTDNGRTLG